MPIIETNKAVHVDGEKTETAGAKVVDAYEIAIAEHVVGFRTIVLSFMLADGCVESFTFPPLYAHALSDELLQASARAAKK